MEKETQAKCQVEEATVKLANASLTSLNFVLSLAVFPQPVMAPYSTRMIPMQRSCPSTAFCMYLCAIDYDLGSFRSRQEQTQEEK